MSAYPSPVRLAERVDARTVYIAGPMTGIEDDNAPAFDRAAAWLRSLGLRVVSPSEIARELVSGDQAAYPPALWVRIDLVAALTLGVGAIALLPGWERSVGARCEVAVALTMGWDFYDAETGDRIPAPGRVTITGGYDRPPGAVASLELLLDECRAFMQQRYPLVSRSSVSASLVLLADHLRDGHRRHAADMLAQLSRLFTNAELVTALEEALTDARASLAKEGGCVA